MWALGLLAVLQGDPTVEGLYRLEQRLGALQAGLDAARQEAQARDQAEAARRAAAAARAAALGDAIASLQALRPDVLFESGDWERALGRASAQLEQAETLGPAPTLPRARAAVAEAQAAVARDDLSAAWAWVQEAVAWAAQTPR
jgi:hypothetical protein